MELWSGTLSSNAAKVRIILAEKQIAYETVTVPWPKEHQREPKPKTLWKSTPRGQVPVLVDDDLTLYDSTVIVEYLNEKHPTAPMMPENVAD